VECLKHPEKGNIVPCLECGKSFCRICNPEKAGQYCPACYEKIVSDFSGKQEREKKPLTKKTKPLKKKRESRVRKVREKITKFNVRVKDKSKSTASTVASLPRKTAVGTKSYFKGRFPITFVEKQELDVLPPLNRTWYKLVAFVLSGAAIWVIVTALVHQRNPLTSIGVAVFVASGVVWTFGAKNDIKVAVFTVMMVLVTLLMVEFTIQILLKYGVITKLDLTPITLYTLKHSGGFYGDFLYKLLIWRIFPSVIIAFLIGFWPAKKRLFWKGFKQSPVSQGKAVYE